MATLSERAHFEKVGCNKTPLGKISTHEWLRRLARFVLRNVHVKWKTRCEIVSEAKDTKERNGLLTKARDLWRSTSSGAYLAQDVHLTDEANAPNDTWTPTDLHNWLQTQKLALDTAKRVNSTKQQLITSWLLPRTTN